MRVLERFLKTHFKSIVFAAERWSGSILDPRRQSDGQLMDLKMDFFFCTFLDEAKRCSESDVAFEK